MNKNLISLDELYKIIKLKELDNKIISFGYSKRKGKKYYVILRENLKPIHFGAINYEDHTIHHNNERRDNFRKRFRSLYEKNKYNPRSAIYWSWNLLW